MKIIKKIATCIWLTIAVAVFPLMFVLVAIKSSYEAAKLIIMDL